MQVTIYNPSNRAGGTNNLLANLAVLLSCQIDIDLHYVEYLNGATLEFVRKNALNCKLLLIQKNEKIVIQEGILIMTLLDVKNIYTRINLEDNVRLLLWSTHPDDGIKILPLFNIFYHQRRQLRILLANLSSPIQKYRTKKFMQEGVEKDGIVWMDTHNFVVNEYFYKIKNFTPVIWPLTTSDPLIKFQNFSGKLPDYKLKIVFLGRLCDFKVIPILDLLDDLSDLKDKIDLFFIGDGNYKDLLETKLDSLGYKYSFLGDIPKDCLDKELVKYDILAGMGTSVLEGAKLGIPSIVMNGTYNANVQSALKFDWIFCVPKFFIGEVISHGEYTPLEKSFQQLILEHQSNSKLIGEKCFTHWKQFHSSISFEKTALKTIEGNKFYFGETKSNLKLTLINKFVNKVKNLIK